MDISRLEFKQKLQSLHYQEFEDFLADLWKKKGYNTNVVDDSTGDKGIDIRATKRGSHEIIQAKRYSENTKIGPKQIREYGSLYIREDNVSQIYVVTTNRFTSGALEEAQEYDVQCMDIDDLYDFIDHNNLEDVLYRYIEGGRGGLVSSSGVEAALIVGLAILSVFLADVYFGFGGGSTNQQVDTEFGLGETATIDGINFSARDVVTSDSFSTMSGFRYESPSNARYVLVRVEANTNSGVLPGTDDLYIFYDGVESPNIPMDTLGNFSVDGEKFVRYKELLDEDRDRDLANGWIVYTVGNSVDLGGSKFVFEGDGRMYNWSLT